MEATESKKETPGHWQQQQRNDRSSTGSTSNDNSQPEPTKPRPGPGAPRAWRTWTPLMLSLGLCGILVAALLALYLRPSSPTTFSQNLILTTDSSSAPLVKTTPPHQHPPSQSIPPVPAANTNKMSTSEQTFIAIKPDGVQRGLVGPIISRFENRGFKLVAIKLVTPGKAHLEKHYADLAGKPFFPGLIEYMNSGPICAMVWEGLDAVKTGRVLLGATNPLASAPGTIRGDYAIQTGRNVCHGSDSVENAQKEIALWFAEKDLVTYKAAQYNWVYES